MAEKMRQEIVTTAFENVKKLRKIAKKRANLCKNSEKVQLYAKIMKNVQIYAKSR
jgi:hypothetical protein